jgi:signal transduction histidine kinase
MWYAVRIGPVWRDGEVVSAMLIARDVSERKRLEEMKDNLIRDVSHELRTPLAKVQMSLELLMELVEAAEIDRERTGRIAGLATNNVARLLETVEGILDLSRLEAGIWSYQLEVLDLGELLYEAYGYMHSLAQVKGLDLEADFAQDLPPVEGDREKLFRVLVNLVDNAIKFTSEGSVRLGARVRDGEVEVAVADTGEGISGENVGRVFERFFQEQVGAQGAGIGLAICRAIVEGHGGRIWAESGGRDQGAVFRFTLPMVEGEGL